MSIEYTVTRCNVEAARERLRQGVGVRPGSGVFRAKKPGTWSYPIAIGLTPSQRGRWSDAFGSLFRFWGSGLRKKPRIKGSVPSGVGDRPGPDVPSAPLDLRHPAVDEQFDARDETAVVGGEEQGDLRDLVGLAKPT
jgi:hypothetical protein